MPRGLQSRPRGRLETRPSGKPKQAERLALIEEA